MTLLGVLNSIQRFEDKASCSEFIASIAEPEVRGGHQSIANRNTVKHSLQIPESSISRVNSDAELAKPKDRISVSFQNSHPGEAISGGEPRGVPPIAAPPAWDFLGPMRSHDLFTE